MAGTDMVIRVGAELGETLSKIDQLKAKLGQTKETVGLLKEELKDMGQSLSMNDKAIARNTRELGSMKMNSSAATKEAAGLRKELEVLRGTNERLRTGIRATKIELESATIAMRTQTAAVKAAENAGSGFVKVTGKIWGGLRKLAYIIPGLGIAGLIGLIVGPLVGAFEELGRILDPASVKLKQYNEVVAGAQNEYVKASMEVSNMGIAFDQAHRGVITKEEALKLYNATLGKTIGETKDFNIAEERYIANADNYIKFTLAKAAAQIAFGKAAEKAFEAEVARQKKSIEFDTKMNRAKSIASSVTMTPGIVPQLQNAVVQNLKAASLAQKNAVTEAINQENSFKKIAKQFLKEAEAFGFDFNAIKEPKPEKIKKIKEKLFKPFKETIVEFFDEASIPVPVFVQAELQFIKDLRPETLFDPVKALITPLKGILGPGAFEEVNIKAKLAGYGITKGFQDGMKMGIEGLRFPQLKDLLTSFEERMKEFQKSITDLTEKTVTGAFENLGSAIGAALSGATDPIGSFFDGIANLLADSLQELGKYIITASTVIASIKKSLNAAFIGNPVMGIAAGVALIAIGAALKNSIPKFANGVDNFSGGMAIVGERGPELVRLPKGADVIPNGRANSMAGANGQVFIPSIVLRGQDLVVAFNRANKTISRNS